MTAFTRNIQELQQLQRLPLEVKVVKTQQRIKEWVDYFGEDGVYISFSGGKDSTVLMDIARKMYPNVPAIFCDTGLEYPEIREFVKTYDNVEWLKPKMTFRQVIEHYGYPFISKEVSKAVDQTLKSMEKGKKMEDTYKGKELLGIALASRGNSSQYNIPQWRFLMDSPYRVSAECCTIMKKAPAKAYNRRTGRKRITAMMATESRNRTSQWLKAGCNAFNSKDPGSAPMSFWTEQDVLQYIKKHDLAIASVYGDIVEEGELEGQMNFGDYAGFDIQVPLKTTGCKRTGCMFCGYGCHLEKPGEGRFTRMKQTHPKQYDFIMRPKEQGGLGFKEVIDWLNENGNLHIEY